MHTIAFTGSAAVGLEILRDAAEVRDGQRHLKRVVAEMGGKNCVLVDSDADLDDAVPGDRAVSAFVYAGQKCSAAARVLAHEAVADRCSSAWPARSTCSRSGRPTRSRPTCPPVIERAAQERVRRYAGARRRATGTVAAARRAVPARGWYCPPTLAVDLDPASPVLREEVFGPLLTVERVARRGGVRRVSTRSPSR